MGGTTMKRSWLVPLVAAVVLGGAGSASALYSPNPAARWAAGHFFLAGDFMFNTEKDLDPRGELEDMTGFYARPAYTLMPNLIVYGRVGMQDADGLDSGFAGGGGVQYAYVLPRAPEWAVGGAFDVMFWDTEGRGGGSVDWTEFQFSPAFSYNVPSIPALTPYGGVAIDFISGDLEEDDPFGVFAGTNFDIGSRLRLDAQFRFLNETGFGFSVGYLF
jgi:hypothetical protein